MGRAQLLSDVVRKLMSASTASPSPQYEPHENPPKLTALGLGFQSTLLCITPIVLFPIIFVQLAGGGRSELSWAVFAMLVVNGVTVVLQSSRIGPVGSGLIVVTYPSAVAIPFCVIAVKEGGPPTLAALVIISALFQVAISMRLSLLRRIVTPTVSGTIIILMILTVVAVVFGNIDDVPLGAPPAAAPTCIGVTLIVSMGLLLRGSGPWRTWAPLAGIGAGWATAAAFGIYDFSPVREAPPVGLPLHAWPGLGLGFGFTFWALLPAFLFLSVVSALQANSIGLSIQQVSWRRPRAMDYRRVQGVGVGSGVGNLLAGLAGAMPISTIPRGTAFVQQTGCASRSIGLVTGAMLVATAILPMTWSLLLGLPGPVSAVFLIVMMTPVFVEGMKLITRDSPDYRKSLIVGVSIAIGLGFQFDLVALPFGAPWGAMFHNGLTSGGAAVVIFSMISEFTTVRRRRLVTDLDAESLSKINRFLADFSSSAGWTSGMTDRLQLVAEETMMILGGEDDQRGDRSRRLVLTARAADPMAELEFITSPSDAENLEDRIAVLADPATELVELELPSLESTVEAGASLRLLRHHASLVSHRQYHETQVITVRVAPPNGR